MGLQLFGGLSSGYFLVCFVFYGFLNVCMAVSWTSGFTHSTFTSSMGFLRTSSRTRSYEFWKRLGTLQLLVLFQALYLAFKRSCPSESF